MKKNLFIAKKSVVDLRKEARPLELKGFMHDEFRLTQLLFGEKIHLLDSACDWCYVEALEQEHYTAQTGWHFYRGYVHSSEISPLEQETSPTHVVINRKAPLSFGTYLTLDNPLVSHDDLRSLLLPFCRERLEEDALLFINAPYLWGGRGAYLREQLISSVDCSGLVNLLYRAQNIQIPRDAYPQFLKCKKISREELKKGDLIYLSKKQTPTKISHVVIYLSPSHVIEAPESGKKVRILEANKEFWHRDKTFRFFDRESEYLPHYGSFC